MKKESTGEDRWMTVCGQCPEVYPWIGNPAGKAQKKTTRRILSTTRMTTTPSFEQDNLPVGNNSEVTDESSLHLNGTNITNDF